MVGKVKLTPADVFDVEFGGVKVGRFEPTGEELGPLKMFREVDSGEKIVLVMKDDPLGFFSGLLSGDGKVPVEGDLLLASAGIWSAIKSSQPGSSECADQASDD